MERRSLGIRAEKIVPGTGRKDRKMKHITGRLLGIAACLVLLGLGAALLAGKDDIRKFYRMRSM